MDWLHLTNSDGEDALQSNCQPHHKYNQVEGNLNSVKSFTNDCPNSHKYPILLSFSGEAHLPGMSPSLPKVSRHGIHCLFNSSYELYVYVLVSRNLRRISGRNVQS